MGMEGMGKEKRKIALEILDEADKIMEMAKMLADEDDPFARRGLYAFLDAEMKALRTLVIWCFPQNNSPFSLYSDGLFGASPSPRLRAGVRRAGKKRGVIPSLPAPYQ
jgi:hypothetical protein